MTRAQVLIIGGVPHLHVTRPGAPAETRPMGQAEMVRLLEEAARAVLMGDDHRLDRGSIQDDPPPCYVGTLGE